MELGLGIHGEPGVKRAHLQPADELSEVLLTEILKYGKFGDERRVVVMINNLGATTEMELAILARHVVPSLEKQGFTVERLYAGTFLSSLDMAGISISVLGLNDGWLRWLDAPTSAPSWPNVLKQRPRTTSAKISANNVTPVKSSAAEGTRSESGIKLRSAIKAACQALIQAEPELTEMDRITGDGDLGTSMKRAANAIQDNLESYPLDDTPATLKALGHTLWQELGGSSGPLYGVLFLRCGNVLEQRGATGMGVKQNQTSLQICTIGIAHDNEMSSAEIVFFGGSIDKLRQFSGPGFDVFNTNLGEPSEGRRHAGFQDVAP
jgi:dihydroxyacetone kinase